jgi:hypothetical protein
MISPTVNAIELSKILKNSVSYSHGFLDGIDANRINFNEDLGLFVEEALGLYIDSKARMSPDQLHHVYEWNRVGIKSARLFDFSVLATKNNIKITGQFLDSRSIPPSGNEPFIKKATIMENKIAVTVSPKNAQALVFEDDGETVFTTSSVYIANPGGDAVAGSFGKVIEEFFNNYLTAGLLQNSGIFDKLSKAKEYSTNFQQGTKKGKSVGVSAGKKYMSLPGGLNIQ